MKLQSKRNYVEKLNICSGICVRKHFYSMNAWRMELENHARLRTYAKTPEVLIAFPGVIVSRYYDYPHMLDVLDDQENSGFSENVWRRFALWFKRIAAVSDVLPSEGNLRNFLWNEGCGEIIPVDLEHWKKLPFQEAAAGIAAFLMEYNPSGSVVKRSACGVLRETWGIDEETIDKKRGELQAYRSSRVKKKHDASLILLAGGKSRRMGSSKAQLELSGKNLLEHQMETAALLGIDDVIVSGMPEDTGFAGSVRDIKENRGPLGGIYSCMKRAKHEKCVVLGVDMPFLDAEMMSLMLAAHENSMCDITLASHNGKYEPLAGVYNTVLADRIDALIAEKGVPVRSLLDQSSVNFVDLGVNPLACYNCNTPEEYSAILHGQLTQSISKNIQS